MNYLDGVEIAKNFVGLYRELIHKSPHLAVHNFRCENSDYSDQLNDSKNAYLCFNGYEIEDCFYTYDSRWNKDCADLTYSNKCELCYECVDCEECYACDFVQDCEGCIDCVHCNDCFGCRNCFGCVGLRKKEYCIFNKQYSRENYPVELGAVKDLDEEAVAGRVAALELRHPHLAMRLRRSENCFGNYVFESKDSNFVFKGHKIQDCVYAYGCGELRDCLDTDMLFRSELVYEAVEATDNYNCNYVFWCANCSNCEYIMYCFDCAECFGCFGLKRKKYHILNVPYSAQEYAELVDLIKKELIASSQYYNFLPDVK